MVEPDQEARSQRRVAGVNWQLAAEVRPIDHVQDVRRDGAVHQVAQIEPRCASCLVLETHADVQRIVMTVVVEGSESGRRPNVDETEPQMPGDGGRGVDSGIGVKVGVIKEQAFDWRRGARNRRASVRAQGCSESHFGCKRVMDITGHLDLINNAQLSVFGRDRQASSGFLGD